MHVAVVIPFFQREPGILQRALRSALDQQGVPPPSIIVVDDSSPIAAQREVEALPEHERARIRILRQPNGGPGGARNRALEAAPGGTQAIAFLDSDDQWFPEHLRRAVSALEAGFDLYFSNYYDIESTDDGFTRLALIDPSRHRTVAGLSSIHEYVGDLRAQIIGRCPIETSTVVYRHARLAGLRFRADFRDAYEDLLFWFDIASTVKRVAFSSQVECQYGRGVNIYRAGVWGTEASLKRIVGSTRFKAHLRRNGGLGPAECATLEAGLARNRRAIATEILHRVRHAKPLLWRHLWQHVKADPRTALTLLPETARQILSHAARQPQA